MPTASVGLAVVAAVLFAVSVNLQQHAARSSALDRSSALLDRSSALDRAEGRTRAGGRTRADGSTRRAWLPVLGLLGHLVRDPAWLLGWLLNVFGFIAHAIALHLGSIAAVQAILVVQLMFAMMLNARRRRIRPLRRDWLATAAVCAGVILLVLQRGPAGQEPPSRLAAAGFLLAVLGLLGLLLVAARGRRHPQVRTALIGVGAGLCFCVTAVFVVVVTYDLAGPGGPWSALDWPVLVLIGSAVTGSLLVQDSFASGSLPTALTAMTITDPVASAVAGAVLFAAAPPSGFQATVGLPLAVGLVAVGVVLLANSTTLHDEQDHRPTRAPAPAR